jgi:hypothetical protein
MNNIDDDMYWRFTLYHWKLELPKDFEYETFSNKFYRSMWRLGETGS